MNRRLFQFFTIFGNQLATVLIILSISFSCINVALALNVEVVDQYGEPVEFAVVSAKQEKSLSNPPSAAVMDQINKQFQPQLLVIASGQKVTFPNSDNIRHHIYSFSKPKPFEIRMFKGGESESLLFEQSGVVVLGCNIHDQMVGYIYVSDQELTAVTNKDGMANIDTSENQILVWHPRLSTDHIKRQVVELDKDNIRAQKIVLPLLPKKQGTTMRKFKSRKFNKGNS